MLFPGDYEFKLTPGLPPADQAVTAVPEARDEATWTHARNR